MKTIISRRDFTRAMLAAGASPSVLPAATDNPALVLVEAESFDRKGGWAVDQQSVYPMGSSYLLAHGWGNPVEDATTKLTFPEPGRYHLFVRTRDWVGPWKSPDLPKSLRAVGSPGRFQILINGEPAGTTFGEEGAEWHWQSGGVVDIPSTKITVALHDLTGFDGRCEAIAFSRSPKFKPPDAPPEMLAWRAELLGHPAEPASAGTFDFVVAGGGTAGICAAVAAARSGLRVAFLQNRPVLGGNSSSEIRVFPNSELNVPPYDQIGNVMQEFNWSWKPKPPQARTYLEADRLKRKIVESEPSISLFLNHHVCGVQKRGDTITAVDAVDTHTCRVHRFAADFFADCTGDAALGYLAKADYRVGRESKAETGEARAPEKADHQVLGSTIHWYTKTTSQPTTFPECPWALQFTEESCRHATQGAWNWETGYLLDQARQTELTRDHKLRAIYGNWAFQKNHSAKKEDYARLELDWVAYVLGKRESRRLMGDVIYSQHDLDKGTEYPDNCVASNWGIDTHFPDPENDTHFPGWAFMAVHRHYDKFKAPMRWMPYRCFYSRNIKNLFMAGRNVSFTHLGFAWFRNQRTTGMMGEVIGLAAALCKEKNATPRDLYEEHFDALKQTLLKGVPPRRS